MENNDELIYITNEPSEETSKVESEATESKEEQVSQEDVVEQEENSETVSEPEVPESTEKEAEDNKAESENEEEQEHEEDHKPKKNSYKRRIDKLKSVISEKDEQIKALEEALKGNQVPNVSDYEDPQAYIDAITNQKVAEQFRNMEQKRLELEQAKLLELQQQSLTEQIQYVINNDPVVKQNLSTEDLPLSGLMENVLLESDNAGALFSYLVKNPKKCQTIAKLSELDPKAAYKEMLKLEAKLELETKEEAKPKPEAKKKPIVSKAPEPQKPVKGSAPKVTNDDGLIYF